MRTSAEGEALHAHASPNFTPQAIKARWTAVVPAKRQTTLRSRLLACAEPIEVCLLTKFARSALKVFTLGILNKNAPIEYLLQQK